MILSLFDKTELSPRDTRPQREKKRARQIVRNIADLCQKMWGVGDFRHVADADSRGGRRREARASECTDERDVWAQGCPGPSCRDTARDVMNTLLLLKHSREDWQEVLTTHPELSVKASVCVCEGKLEEEFNISVREEDVRRERENIIELKRARPC